MGAISSAEQPSRSSSLFSSPALHTYNQNSSTDDDVKAVQTITCFSLISCLPLIIMYQSYAQCHHRPASCNTKREKSDKRNNNHIQTEHVQTGSLLRERNKTCSHNLWPPPFGYVSSSLSLVFKVNTLMYSCRESLRDNNSCSCSGSIPRRNDVANKQHLQQLPTVSLSLIHI